ncbi:hypothetical protein GCM10010872_28970 [Dyella flava]|nr:hypothetical protein GCM10010872_28970 [Dyella flava]
MRHTNGGLKVTQVIGLADQAGNTDLHDALHDDAAFYARQHDQPDIGKASSQKAQQ